MKKLTLQSLAALLLAVLISFSSCSKEGPEGPAGAQGQQGAQGPQGPEGDQGEPGTANVIYSEWTTQDFLPDTIHNGNVVDTVSYTALIEAERLDATMISTGEMKVYVNANTENDPTVFPLPYNDGLIYIDVVFRIGEIYITSNVNLSDAPFRYVLIPGGTAARKAGPELVDWNNYNSVKKYLNLKD